ncbi:MAG: O-antigen ligase family protein, partial [Verrucomicrobiota bacterium]|nr:O-antigen ligase family protein [Verrucomicrobiota bacterium]
MTIRSGSLLTRLCRFLGSLAAMMFAALSFSSSAVTRFYQWPWFFYWQLLLVAPVAILGFRLLSGRHLPRFGGGLDAGLGLLAAINFVAALRSPFRPQSLNAALIPIAAVSLAYLWLDWIERDPPRREERIALLSRFVGVLMLLFVVVSLSCWWFTLVMPAWMAGGASLKAALSIRNTEPFGHSVYTAGFAVLAAPWLAVNGLLERGWRRWFWLAIAALALAIVPTTASRGGVLASGTVLAGAAVLCLVRSSFSRGLRALVTIGVLLTASLLVALDPRLRGLVLHGHWSRIASESNDQRKAMLEAGWLMGRDRPWTGYGPATVSLIYPHYRAGLSDGGADDVLQLHNTPAQFWAELGIPGLLAGMLLIAGIINLARDFRQQCKCTVSPESQPHRLRTQAVLIAFIGYATMCLFDYQFDVPLFAAVAATLLALARVSAANAGKPGSATGLPMLSKCVARLSGSLLLVA